MKLLNRLNFIAGYSLYIIAIIIIVDVCFNKFLGYGYLRHFQEENVEHYPSPYVMFSGKPNVGDHNEFGFHGLTFIESDSKDLKISFFGGSTGHQGNPPIAEIIEKELHDILGKNVFVANYSIVSSNHRQHLHGMIEYSSKFKPDIIIFYGGYNETIHNAFYDPRPGYPYNHFYRAETRPFMKFLLENSALIGTIDKRTGIFSGLSKLRNEQRPFSDEWNIKIIDNYFETLKLANEISGTIESKHYERAKFFAFYQPYQVPREFASSHEEIKKRISTIEYVYDVSSEYDTLGKEVYKDIVHVNQSANELMGKKIARIIANALQRRSLQRRCCGEVSSEKPGT